MTKLRNVTLFFGALFFAAYCLLAGEVSAYLNTFTPVDLPAWLLTGAGWLVGAAVVFAALGTLIRGNE